MTMQTTFPDEAPSRVIPLLSVIAAIGLWLGADEINSRAREIEVQAGSAAMRVSRGSPDEIALRQREAKALEQERLGLSSSLGTTESEQMTRAKLVFELRQKCDSVPVACQVRLADLTSAAKPPAAGAGGTVDAETTLESLGVSKARAILTGSFKTNELEALYRSFAEDTQAQWRMNGIVVKGNTFEFDVERLMLRVKAGSQ